MQESTTLPINTLAALVSQQLPPGLVNDHQWPDIFPLALHHGLGPMLHWVLKNAGIDPDEEVRWEPLASAAQEAAINYALLTNTQAQVDAALAKAGVPALWLKGIALAPTVYPQPWLRPMADLDLLVPYRQRKLALTAARSLGFHSGQGLDWMQVIDMPENVTHQDYLERGVAGVVRLELHYWLLGILGKELLPGEQMDWVWSQTQPSNHNSSAFRVLKPEANLLYLCAHAILQHSRRLYLLRYFDLHLLVTKAELDWHLIVDRALELRWSYALERALSLAVRFFDTPVPESVFTQLQERRSSHEDISIADKFQSKDFRREKRKMLLAQMSPGVRIRILFGRVFPLQSYMRYHFGIKPGRPVFPYYLYRWFDKIRQVARSVRSRLARNPRM